MVIKREKRDGGRGRESEKLDRTAVITWALEIPASGFAFSSRPPCHTGKSCLPKPQRTQHSQVWWMKTIVSQIIWPISNPRSSLLKDSLWIKVTLDENLPVLQQLKRGFSRKSCSLPRGFQILTKNSTWPWEVLVPRVYTFIRRDLIN